MNYDHSKLLDRINARGDEKAVTANWIRKKLRNMAAAQKAKRLTTKAQASTTSNVSLRYHDWSDDEVEGDDAFRNALEASEHAEGSAGRWGEIEDVSKL